MHQEITLPDGSVVEFPDGMAQDAMLGVIKSHSVIGGILHSIMNPQILEKYRKPVGEFLADVIPVSAQQRSIERMGESVEGMEDKSTIGKMLGGADIALEGAGLVADFVPGLKAGAMVVGALAPAIKKALKIRGLRGDKLLDAEDLIGELKGVGAKIDGDGMVTVYHRTSKENVEKIIATGEMNAKEPDIFFSTSKESEYGAGFGGDYIEAKIPVEQLRLDDIFPSVDASVSIHVKGPIGTPIKVNVTDSSVQSLPMDEASRVKFQDKTTTPIIDDSYANPEYYAREKGVETTLENISPRQYIKKAAHGFGVSYDDLIFNRGDDKVVKEYMDAMAKGDKFPALYLDNVGGFNQEGLHRAIAAERLGVETVPVFTMNKIKPKYSTMTDFTEHDKNLLDQLLGDFEPTNK